jgi:hypothetical protein
MNPIEYLNEFYRHVSTNSILVVTAKGELIRLFCPFKVKSKVSFPDLPEGAVVWVERVQITPELKDVYIISGKAYFTIYFQLATDETVHPSNSTKKMVGWTMHCIQ